MSESLKVAAQENQTGGEFRSWLDAGCRMCDSVRVPQLEFGLPSSKLNAPC